MVKIVRSKKNQQIYLVETGYTTPDGRTGIKILGGPYKSKELAVKARNRKERNEAMESIAMTKVKGNLGSTYWE